MHDTLLPEPSADGTLVLAYLAGDDDAGAALVRRHDQRLVGAMARWTDGHHGDARDLAQEAWLRAFAALDRFDPTAPLWPWLRRIGDNVARSWLRRELTATGRREVLVGALPSAMGVVDDGAAVRAEQAAVHDVLTTLPERHRSVLSLVYLADVEQVDAASMLGITHGALRVRLSRARGEFRRRVDRVLGMPLLPVIQRWFAPAAQVAAAAAAGVLLLPHAVTPASPTAPMVLQAPADQVVAAAPGAIDPEPEPSGVDQAGGATARPEPTPDAAVAPPGEDHEAPAGAVPEPDELGVPECWVTVAADPDPRCGEEHDPARTRDERPYEYRVQYVEEHHPLLTHDDEERAEVHDPACETADALPRMECGPSRD